MDKLIPPGYMRMALGLFGVFVLIALIADTEEEAATVERAFDWFQRFAGVVVLLWSGKEVQAAWTNMRASRVLGTTPAIAGALAGGLLLGVGAWATPAALGLVGVMEGVTRWKSGNVMMTATDAPPPTSGGGQGQNPKN